MKVLLVCKNKKMEYLGVMYLSAVIKRLDSECRIVTIEEAPKVFREWNPHMVGFSIMTGDQALFGTLARFLKEIRKDFTLVIGGPHPSFFADDWDLADIVVCGEAESDMAMLLDANHTTYYDIDSIPHPDRTDFPNQPIRDFISSRGCNHDCRYCFNAQWAELHKHLPRVRTRNVDDVIKEIVEVAPKFAYFQDSCFGVNVKWVEEFSEKFRKTGIPFHCHLRPAQATEHMVSLLAKANCKSLRYALETGSDRLKELIGRKHTSNQDTYNASKNLKKHNIRFMIQNMLGLPTSTIEEDLETLEVNIIAQPDYAWSSIFVPYPGTGLGDMCKEKGLYKGDYSDISDCFFEMSILEVSNTYREQIYHLQKVFDLCVMAQYLPKPEELLSENFPMLIHNLMRKVGDKKMYGGVI